MFSSSTYPKPSKDPKAVGKGLSTTVHTAAIHIVLVYTILHHTTITNRTLTRATSGTTSGGAVPYQGQVVRPGHAAQSLGKFP